MLRVRGNEFLTLTGTFTHAPSGYVPDDGAAEVLNYFDIFYKCDEETHII